MSDMNGLDLPDFDEDGFDDAEPDEDGDDSPADGFDDGPDCDRLEDELRRAAAVLDPVPAELYRIAVEAYALHDLDARIAELTFDSLTDAIPVRGVLDPPRMLTFRTGELSVDVEVTSEGLMGQVLPPQAARIEVLSGPRTAAPLTADDLGRFTCDAPPAGPFALRLRTGAEVVVTEWLRA
ncbi:hypothetical protein [Streptomyces sp. NPDC002265]|uniref:hypothetical protein n=1 Tax=Streptomyces sp. NPDC002265 TaxID=3154415 RepID=UPI00331DBB9F